MDWVLDKVVDQSDCGASVDNTKITDLVFADDAVIFAESLEVLVMALEALHEEAKPLGLEVSWLKTKVQVFGDLLDEAVHSVHACGEDIEILESFTYLGSAVHNDGGSRQEVLRRIGIAHGVMDSLSGSIWRCRYLCRRTKIRIFKSLVIPVLLYGCETWTLNSDLKRRINAFGNKCLRRIMGRLKMVTHLITGLSQAFPEIIFPTWSPQPSPTLARRGGGRSVPDGDCEKHFFMEFSCLDKPLGRVVIKVLRGAGEAGLEFKYLVTGQNGFGYKGSRVYASCKDEWCLLGDLLYLKPIAHHRLTTDWDPYAPDAPHEEEDEGATARGGEGEGPVYRQLYRGYSKLIRTQVIPQQAMTRGAVVAVASDYDMATATWTLGPQVKICLSDSLLRSGHVVGAVTEGMEVAHQLSRVGGQGYGPEARISISHCGAL
ncbi:putative uncharacterized transposon-derived protein F52C9.6 [Chionoecetes opilio]|uniref:Uncharacterized transposon-derived protein F52C9.6 n=1 Tax=Chionoecetes opilio TaxID=41210 RepID=A0A8J4XS47_CHIOP|nr:putative uncharacterized transposon-derived protein F52C9.6 [Chionoecetes opilio]